MLYYYTVMLQNLGRRIDFHMHTLLSDGGLLPSELARRAEAMDYEAIAMTDHVDSSNIEAVIKGIKSFISNEAKAFNLKIIPGVEITHVPPKFIEMLAKKARKLGAKLVVVHGETPVEPVTPGTNHKIATLKGLVDIMAHPGNTLTEEDANLAAKNGIFLEITAKKGHKEGNHHVAELARKTGAKLLVNTDTHEPDHLITQEQAFNIAREAGLSDKEAFTAVVDNANELLKRVYK
jgi:putative hydrolase